MRPGLIPEDVTDLVPPPEANWRGSLRRGYLVVLIGIGAFGFWAATARLDGAAIAVGVVSAESNRKTLQHLEGGIVSALTVRDGDFVREGQALLRLDATRVGAQSHLARNRLSILLAEEARLDAEMAEREPVYPAEVREREAEAEVAAALADQAREFEARRLSTRQKLELAESRIAQVRKEMAQNEVALETARRTLANVDGELEPLRPLFEQQLVPVTRMRVLEREKLRLTGEIASREIQAVRFQDLLQEQELQREQVIRDNRQLISARLSELRRSLNEARQLSVVASDAERRIDILAPITGTVQQLRVFTIGGVVRPGEPILDIVPASDDLVIRAKISPLDVDRVVPGMPAELRFPAFRYFGSKTIRGTLRSISRDRIVEDNGRDIFFAAEVSVDRSTLPADMDSKLSAGMPADVIIPTGERTVLDYLIAPLADRFNRSMRER